MKGEIRLKKYPPRLMRNMSDKISTRMNGMRKEAEYVNETEKKNLSN